jgi:hypothetical protein
MKRPQRVNDGNVSFRTLNKAVNDCIECLDAQRIMESPTAKRQETSGGTILQAITKSLPGGLTVRRLRVTQVLMDYLVCAEIKDDDSIVVPPPEYIVAKQLNARGSGQGYHGMAVTMDGSWNGRTIDTGFSYTLRNAQIVQTLEPSYGLDEIYAIFSLKGKTGIIDGLGVRVDAIEIAPARTWITAFQFISFTGADGKQKQMLVQGSNIVSTPP